MASDHVLNILFHGVGKPARELEPGEDVYWVTEDRFRSILDEISGWPEVRISFDDSNSSDLEIALPALIERGLTADFFVLAGRRQPWPPQHHVTQPGGAVRSAHPARCAHAQA